MNLRPGVRGDERIKGDGPPLKAGGPCHDSLYLGLMTRLFVVAADLMSCLGYRMVTVSSVARRPPSTIYLANHRMAG